MDWAHVLLIIQGAWLTADFHYPDVLVNDLHRLGQQEWSRFVWGWIVLLQALVLMLKHLKQPEASFRSIAQIFVNAGFFLIQRGGRFLASGQGLARAEQLSLTAVLVSVALASWFNRVAREEPTRTSH